MAPKLKKKAIKPPDPVRFNKLEALEKLKKLALFRGTLKDSMMDREVYDHFSHMNLKTRKYTGPSFDPRMRKQFAMHKEKIRKVLVPRCLAFEDVPTKEYVELKEWSLNLPHSRYQVCTCSVITDGGLTVLPPAPWPDYLDRTPTFQ
ncbi:hypothetical protein M758_6G140200 [Ceratodon purpureus]|uniref:Uncharacterized protein n=1 Tax=Ceratodon purpureus TaxID=3225 RepID=A0A8T0HI40_CERPU|nr:hypothetical protein KC19_6G145500 [Ceratodon purpureus]KAG0613951.1 hypothetical protein M758_6G140200 [Ceratodon purpureus]